MHPKNLSIADFSYELPDDRIARYPLEKRDSSKLLVYKSGAISETTYEHLAAQLPEHSMLVFNDTRVVEARLFFEKATGGVIEVFCLEPDQRYADITTAMLQKGEVFWKCLIGGASKWKHGMVLEKQVQYRGETILVSAAITERLSDSFIIHLQWSQTDLSFAEILHAAGMIPLPPYLHREAEEADKERYQTVYAKEEGSVAAPTAGLHFTEQVFASLDDRNIARRFVTLHVGAGTFKPVKSETMEGHEMHAEFIDVPASFITELAHFNGTVVAVGTTSLRTLETLYWMGVKAALFPEAERAEDLMIHQWDAYEIPPMSSTQEALQALSDWMAQRNMTRLITRTQILIAPGYTLRTVHGIVTNFHQPHSTLLLLVAAAVGDDWRRIYRHALDHEFRFLSYGDGSLLWANC